MRRCSKCKTTKSESQFAKRRTWCDHCLTRWEAKRSTPEARAKLYKRFHAKVAKTSDCWYWTGARTDKGYGTIGVEGRTCYAHRIAYERWIAPIPSGSHIDHLCRKPACVNPAHLEAVTQKENTRRGSLVALKTHCAQGHPWTDEHIYIRPGNGHKMCRTCSVERSRIRRRSGAPPKPRVRGADATPSL
jgi:hypothetical protein